MADDNLTLMIEANRRGLLPPDKKRDFDEAVRRGLVPSEASGVERFMMGVTDPARGIMEIAQQIMGKPEAKAATPDEGAKPKDVPIAGEVISPTDPMRLAGNIANPTNLITPLAASRVTALSPMAKTVLSSTIPALLQPVGETDDFLGEKGKQAGTGVVLGYGLSVAGKGVSKGVDALGRWLVSRYPDNIMSNAVSLVLKRIEQDQKAGGPTAKNMLDLIRAASAEGRPLTLADVGKKNVEKLAGSVYRRGGEGGAIAEQLFETRDQAAANRLRQNIAQYIHGGMTVFEATEALLTARSAAARPLYEHTDSLQGIWSPRLAEFFKDPVVKAGMTRGYELERTVSLAENRAFDPTAMGVDISDPNNIQFLRAPNMRVLDMAKQGLDSMIADERNEITGRLSARGVALDKLRRGYLGEIDSLDKTGVYRKAREAWGGYSASLDALRSGRAVFTASPEENAALVSSFKSGSGDMEFYRMGVADMLNERIAKAGFSADEAKALIKNDWMRRQLKPAFLSDNDFNTFVESVTQESQMFARRRSITGGSQTAERLAEDQSPMTAQAETGATIGLKLAAGKIREAIPHLWRMYRDFRTLPDSKLSEATAKILFSPLMPHSRSEVANAIRSLDVKNPPKHPVPLVANRGNYLSGPARTVQDLLAPIMAAESGEISGGRPLPLPHYQAGGDAPAGQPIVVGERGPEVVVPKQDVSIVPDIDTHDINSLLYRMGSGPVPPETDELTRALPGYEQRSPGELAMIRTKAGVRPLGGRADISPEHAAQMLVTGASLYAAPESLAARGIAAAPKTMTALLAALGVLSSSPAGSAEPDLSTVEGIKEFQREAKKQGIYDGNIDGQMGPKTIEAKKAFDAAKAKAIEDARKDRELKLREEEAAAKKGETALGEKKLEEKKSGQEELKKVEENLPTWRRILRNYGPQVGYLAGVGVGEWAKRKAVGLFNRSVRAPEKLFDPRARKIEERVANINKFYREGGASAGVPFVQVPGSSPGFAANPNVAGLESLYPSASRAKRLGANFGPTGVFGGEMAGGHLMKPSDKQMADAYKAVSEDPSSSNIDRLQSLKDQDAWSEFLISMGRTGAATSLGGILWHPLAKRPSTSAAETEKMALEKYLRDRTAPPPAKPRQRRVTKKKTEEE
jgi:hypothetical protein